MINLTLHVYRGVIIIYKKNVEYFLFFINNNNLLKVINKLYFLLIEKRGLVNVNYIKTIDYKRDNLRLR